VLKRTTNKEPTAAHSSPLAMRNFQLALASLPFSLLAILLSPHDRSQVIEQGFLHNYTFLTYFVVLNQAIGGLLIAAVVKEADSVSKGFATSAAVLLSTVVSSIGTQTLPSPQFVVGASLVVMATIMFAIT